MQPFSSTHRSNARAIAKPVGLVLLALTLAVGKAAAQQTAADSGKALLSQAAAAFNKGTPDNLELARQLWGQAAALFRRTGDRASEAQAVRGMGQVHYRRSRPDSAIVQFRRELLILTELGEPLKIGVALHTIGAMYNMLGLSDSALVTYRQAIPLFRQAGDRVIEARGLGSVGGILVDTGHPDSALVYLRSALAILREHKAPAVEALFLTTMGRAFRGLTRPDSALAAYGKAVAIQRELRDTTNLDYTLSNMGSLQLDWQRPDSALVFYLQALRISRAAGNREREAGTLNTIGLVHFRRGRPDSARAYYRQGVVTATEINDRNQLGRLLNNIGETYGAAQQADSAMAYFERSLPLRRQAGDRPGAAITLRNIGQVHADAGRPDSALVYYEQALALHRAVGNRIREMDALGSLAQFHQKTRLNPRAAAAYYDSTTAVFAEIAKRSGGDANWLSFAESTFLYYEQWALSLLALRNEMGEGENAKAALAATERGRAQALLQLLQGASEQAGNRVLQERLARPGADLATEASLLLAPLRQERAAALSYLLTPDTLLTWLQTPDGEVRISRTPVRRDSLSSLIAAMRAQLGADAGRKRMVRGASFEQEGARGIAAGISGGTLESTLKRLSALLLPRELEQLLPPNSEIVIVPQGALALVSFAALPLTRSGETLGVRYALRYAPSFAALHNLQAAPELKLSMKAAGETALVIGDPAMPWVRNEAGDSTQLRPLPAAGAEGRWIAGEFRTEVLTGKAASESAVRRRLGSASLVHLATHGLAFGTEARVRNSYVALSPDSAADGLLTIGELLDDENLKISADLVVLSACQTGLGDLKNAEGTVGLQRAFLAKGARSVLVSLWSVDDEATRLLMQKFYTHWRGGQSLTKAEALRRAQADVRKTKGFEHPSMWASFQLVGAR